VPNSRKAPTPAAALLEQDWIGQEHQSVTIQSRTVSSRLWTATVLFASISSRPSSSTCSIHDFDSLYRAGPAGPRPAQEEQEQENPTDLEEIPVEREGGHRADEAQCAERTPAPQLAQPGGQQAGNDPDDRRGALRRRARRTRVTAFVTATPVRSAYAVRSARPSQPVVRYASRVSVATAYGRSAGSFARSCKENWGKLLRTGTAYVTAVAMAATSNRPLDVSG